MVHMHTLVSNYAMNGKALKTCKSENDKCEMTQRSVSFAYLLRYECIMSCNSFQYWLQCEAVDDPK